MRDDPLVYSTDGPLKPACPRCGRHPCRCAPEAPGSGGPPLVRIRLEKKGRGGKVVTVLYDLPTGPEDGLALAKRIKALCGSGGTFKDGRIEVQGEHRPRLQGFLEGLGYRVRLSGG